MMDEHELDKQFEATDYDEEGNIVQTPPPPISAKKKRITVAELTKTIDELAEVVEEDVLKWLGELAIRLEELEQVEKPRTRQALAYLQTQQDTTNAALDTLVNALRSHIKESAATPPEPAQKLEFAQPPMVAEKIPVTKGDIEEVARVCQTMTDVLMICRALKAAHDLPDEDRTYLLTIACRMAGVPLSPGLQIRAGATSGGV